MSLKIALKYIITLCFLGFVLTSCEEEFTPPITSDPDQIVVEGYIEGGASATPPYVVITNSVPFFSEISTEDFNSFFVHDAEVIVREGNNEVTLTEVCLDNLTGEQKEQFASLFGFDPENLQINFCVYFDLSFQMIGEEGKTYDLEINVEDKQLTASTQIPPHIQLDSVIFQKPVGEVNDSLREMRCFLKDPADLESYYRYFTSTNSEAMIPGFNSVFDDGFFNGTDFEFPLAKAEPRNGTFDQETFGLYYRGDTATLKWTNIDIDHYTFWSTLEFSASNQGPFSSYTRIASNIEGGLGIWGGYSNSFYERVVE